MSKFFHDLWVAPCATSNFQASPCIPFQYSRHAIDIAAHWRTWRGASYCLWCHVALRLHVTVPLPVRHHLERHDPVLCGTLIIWPRETESLIAECACCIAGIDVYESGSCNNKDKPAPVSCRDIKTRQLMFDNQFILICLFDTSRH